MVDFRFVRTPRETPEIRASWFIRQMMLDEKRAVERAALAGEDPSRLRGMSEGFLFTLQDEQEIRLEHPPNPTCHGLTEFMAEVQKQITVSLFDEPPLEIESLEEAQRHAGAVAALFVGLKRLEREGELVCPAVHDTALIFLLQWAALRLGWRPRSERACLLALCRDADPVVKQRALLRLLGGWNAKPPETPEIATLARAALHSTDPWIRGVCLPHLGPDANAEMGAFVLEPTVSDALVEQVLNASEMSYPPSLSVKLLSSQRAVCVK